MKEGRGEIVRGRERERGGGGGEGRGGRGERGGERRREREGEKEREEGERERARERARGGERERARESEREREREGRRGRCLLAAPHLDGHLLQQVSRVTHLVVGPLKLCLQVTQPLLVLLELTLNTHTHSM